MHFVLCNTMTQLTIRGIDDKLKRALRLRAAENGWSMEEEVRRILRAALAVPSPAEEGRRKLEELAAKEIESRRRRGR